MGERPPRAEGERSPRPLRLMLVAGEPSGDVLGGRLMAALKARLGAGVTFLGIGGETMAAQGLDSLFPMEDLSLMGLVEVAPRIPRLLRRLREAEALTRRERPDAVVTIDIPAFTFRLLERLRDLDIPKVHYVAPQLWAWRPGRVRRMPGLFDRLLALLPFEEDWFAAHGVVARFVGHPVLESPAARADGKAFRARHGVDAKTPLLAVLPGSRRGEALRHLSVFRDAAAGLARRVPDLRVVIPTLGPAAPMVRAEAGRWPVPALVVEEAEARYDAMAAADAALSASGTVALELALARTPMVVAYRVNPLTAWLARRLITVPHVCLVNIILGRDVVPELLQEDCRPDRLVPALARLLTDPEARSRQTEAANAVALALGEGGEPPSLRAADAVLEVVSAHRLRAAFPNGKRVRD